MEIKPLSGDFYENELQIVHHKGNPHCRWKAHYKEDWIWDTALTFQSFVPKGTTETFHNDQLCSCTSSSHTFSF